MSHSKPIPELSEKDVERFWSKVEPLRDPSTCWEWQGSVLRHHLPYGRFKAQGRTHLAHRVSWFIAAGKDAGPLQVLHRCDNPRCVNPHHLFLGTHLDNMRDRNAKGRQASGDRTGLRVHPDRVARGNRHGSRTKPESVLRGEKNGKAVLTEELVIDICNAARNGEGATSIARRLGLKEQTVSHAIAGRTWKHVIRVEEM